MDHHTQLLIDSHGRTLRDLRVSVTDRCNFRCLYCLPETEAAANCYRDRWATVVSSTPIARQWKHKSKILTFEEIERVVRLAVDLGIQKVRLTGGEPLLRQELEILVERLAAIPGVEDLATTSNGFLFPKKGKVLRDAGLRRITCKYCGFSRDNPILRVTDHVQHVIRDQSYGCPNLRREEVHRRQNLGVGTNEFPPCGSLFPIGCRQQTVPLSDVRYRLMTDLVSQVAERTDNPPVSPATIFPGKLQYHFFDRLRRQRTPNRRSALRSVELHGNEFEVPAKNGFGANNLLIALQIVEYR